MPIRFGVYDKLPPLLANSLGAYETTLMRMVTGYSEFVNGGKKIQAIADRPHPGPQRQDHLAPRRAQLRRLQRWQLARPAGAAAGRYRASRSSIPAPPIRSSRCWKAWSSAAPAFRSRAVGKPLAGKTGTSSEAQDTWFIGFSPDLAAGVFVGFDNPRTLGGREQGATVAAPIFRDFMKGALADAPPTPFRVAPGIEEVPIDWKSGDAGAAGHAGRHHGSLQGRHRAGRGQCRIARHRHGGRCRRNAGRHGARSAAHRPRHRRRYRRRHRRPLLIRGINTATVRRPVLIRGINKRRCRALLIRGSISDGTATVAWLSRLSLSGWRIGSAAPALHS